MTGAGRIGRERQEAGEKGCPGLFIRVKEVARSFGRGPGHSRCISNVFLRDFVPVVTLSRPCHTWELNYADVEGLNNEMC